MDILAKINEFLGEEFPDFNFLEVKPKHNFNYGDTLFCVASELERNKIEYENTPNPTSNLDCITEKKNDIAYYFIAGKLFEITINFTDKKIKDIDLFVLFIKSYFKYERCFSNCQYFYFFPEEEKYRKTIFAELYYFDNKNTCRLRILDHRYTVPLKEEIPTETKIEPTKPQQEEKMQSIQEQSEAERLKDIIRKRTE